MFSFNPCDELYFDTLTTPQAYQIPQDLIINHSLSDTNLISFAATTFNDTQPTNSRPRPTDQSKHGRNFRKGMHREIERKRRQEMSGLYASLGSLLPPDHIKGKSSVCDQMGEAVNYIKEMHKRIQELQTRRDIMKKLDKCSSSRANVESSYVGDKLTDCVVIHRIVDGVEILISHKSPELELSRILSELMERDVDVVSFVSTRTKGGFLHKFQVQAKDVTSIDVSVLHDRLTDAIK